MIFCHGICFPLAAQEMEEGFHGRRLCWNDDFHGRGFQASGGFQGFARFLHRIQETNQLQAAREIKEREKQIKYRKSLSII